MAKLVERSENTRTAKLNLEGPYGGTVEINGQDISRAVRGLRVDHSVGNHPQLTLDLLVHVGEVEGEMIVIVEPATADTLVALGWTPPDEQPVSEVSST